MSKLNFEIFYYLQSLNPATIVLLIGLQILTVMFISHQWLVLLKVFKPLTSFLKVIELNLIGTFTESITPAVKSGGEGVKLVLLNKKFGLQYNEGLSVIILQKTISFILFTLLFLISLIGTRFKFTVEYRQFLVPLLFVFVITLVFLLLPKDLKDKVTEFINKVIKNLLIFKGKKQLLLYLVFNNLLVWLGYPLKLFIIANSLGVNLSFFQLSTIIFITYGVSMLPTTPGSIGTYEGTMTLLFKLFAVELEKALAIALITRFFTFWLVIIISGLYLVIIKLSLKLSFTSK